MRSEELGRVEVNSGDASELFEYLKDYTDVESFSRVDGEEVGRVGQ